MITTLQIFEAEKVWIYNLIRSKISLLDRLLFNSESFNESNFTEDSGDMKEKINSSLPSIYTLLEGNFSLDIGAIINMRLYGPYTCRKFKEATPLEWFKADKQEEDYESYNGKENDPNYQLSYATSVLYPSVSGILSQYCN